MGWRGPGPCRAASPGGHRVWQTRRCCLGGISGWESSVYWKLCRCLRPVPSRMGLEGSSAPGQMKGCTLHMCGPRRAACLSVWTWQGSQEGLLGEKCKAAHNPWPAQAALPLNAERQGSGTWTGPGWQGRLACLPTRGRHQWHVQEGSGV